MRNRGRVIGEGGRESKRRRPCGLCLDTAYQQKESEVLVNALQNLDGLLSAMHIPT